MVILTTSPHPVVFKNVGIAFEATTETKIIKKKLESEVNDIAHL